MVHIHTSVSFTR